jgi:hypothetical protein
MLEKYGGYTLSSASPILSMFIMITASIIMAIPVNWKRVSSSSSIITPSVTLTTGSKVLRMEALDEPVSRSPVKKSRFDKKVEKKALDNTASQALGVTAVQRFPVNKAEASSVMAAADVI